MKTPKKTIIASLLAAAFFTACADGPLAPNADLPLAVAEGKPGGASSSSSGPEFIYWIAPLSQDISQSALCFPNWDCVVKIDAVGSKINIPRGALTVPTFITMTAVAGDEVDLRFAPHGLQFESDVKVKVQQDKTTGTGSTFTAYYHDGLDNILDTMDARLRRGHITFTIEHFSGYALGM